VPLSPLINKEKERRKRGGRRGRRKGREGRGTGVEAHQRPNAIIQSQTFSREHDSRAGEKGKKGGGKQKRKGKENTKRLSYLANYTLPKL